MRIYVDELPETCLDCENVLCEHQIIEACYATRHPDCPLHSLDDYTKQVIKEVCEIIWGGFIGLNNINGNYEYKKFEDDFRKFLDQIQGETECQKN